jgi:hypothetical protein
MTDHVGEPLTHGRPRVNGVDLHYATGGSGDPVVIKNTAGPNLEVWDGYGDFQLSFEEYIAAT